MCGVIDLFHSQFYWKAWSLGIGTFVMLAEGSTWYCRGGGSSREPYEVTSEMIAVLLTCPERYLNEAS